MKKMVDTGIPMRKGIAMGMHDEMYASSKGGKTKPKPGYGAPKGPKPVKMGGKGGY